MGSTFGLMRKVSLRTEIVFAANSSVYSLRSRVYTNRAHLR